MIEVILFFDGSEKNVTGVDDSARVDMNESGSGLDSEEDSEVKETVWRKGLKLKIAFLFLFERGETTP